MRRSFLAFFPFPALLGLLACSPSSSPVLDRPAGPSPAGALEKLAKKTGAPWRVRYHEDVGTVAFLEGRTAPLDTPDRLGTAAREFLLGQRALFGLRPEDELTHQSSRMDELGMRHLRFVQTRGKLPVWGTALTIHLDPQGGVRRVHGRTVPLPDTAQLLRGTPVDAETARQLALQQVQADLPQASLSALAPEALLLPFGDEVLRVFRVEVEGQTKDLPVRRELMLDALRGGALVRQTDLVAALNVDLPAAGSGTGALGAQRQLSVTLRGARYYLEDQVRGHSRTTAVKPGEKLPGRTVYSAAADRWDEGRPGQGLAVDVHAHLGAVWDYFARSHRLYGWAGDGRGIVAVAHLGDRQAVALFDGKRLLFGDGDGQDFLPSGAALDVVAHEYTHAVVRSLAGLHPEGESGALDEGIADLFACLIDQAQGPEGDWTVGETIYRPGGRMTPLRDLADPRRTDQARTMTEMLAARSPEGPQDRRWMAVRAGIIGHAGYQLAIRLGNARAAAIWYRAISTYLFKLSTFSDAADATLAAARDLHGDSSPLLRDVAAAWSQVDVGTIETIGETARP